MNFLRGAVSEIIGLFVDDWAFALLLVVWIGLFAVFGSHLPVKGSAVLFFAGIAVLVLVFVARRAIAARSRP